MPANPTEQDEMSTGMMMNLPEPPAHLCSCKASAEERTGK
jgi:hypothetical protein